MTQKHKPERGKIVVVSEIPVCDFCEYEAKMTGTSEVALGPYDFPTRQGLWASGCEKHWKQHRASANLGVGTGQLWITEDQVERTPLEQAKRESRKAREDAADPKLLRKFGPDN